MRRFSALVLVSMVLGVAWTGTARAQGYGVYEQGACTMGRGGAGVAAPCPDGSGVFFNPAGLSFGGAQITLGGVGIAPAGQFTDSSTGQVSALGRRWYPAPNVYVSTPVGKRLAVGFGVFAPYGLTTHWPDTSEGRFLGYKSLVEGVYLQPTVSVKLTDRLSVGAGVDISYLRLELRQRLDLSTQALAPGLTFAALGVRAGTDFADIRMTGDGWHAGGHLGLLFRASDRWSFGARYLSGQTIKVTDGRLTATQISAVRPDGSRYVLPVTLGRVPAGTPLDALVASQFATGGTLSDQSMTTHMPLPAQAVAGVAFQATRRIRLLADYQFTKWSAFDELAVTGQYLDHTVAENYRDTHGVRVGSEIAIGSRHTLRLGFNGHSAAAPDETVTPNLPEASRREYSAGFGSQLSRRIRVDLAYLYLWQPDRAGRTGNLPNNGLFDFTAHLFGASMTIGL